MQMGDERRAMTTFPVQNGGLIAIRALSVVKSAELVSITLNALRGFEYTRRDRGGNMHRLTKVWMALLVVVLIVSGLPAEAQTSKGTLAGVVRDASGAVIANADVTVINEATTETRQTKSNEQGEYRVDAISAGSYSVRAEAQGFQAIYIKGLEVNRSVIPSYGAARAGGATAVTV